MMDWINEHQEFFLGMAVGGLFVLVYFCFVTSRLSREVKELGRAVAEDIERTDRENDAG